MDPEYFYKFDYRTEWPDYIEEDSKEYIYFCFTRKLFRTTNTEDWRVIFDGTTFIVEFPKTENNYQFLSNDSDNWNTFEGIPIVMRWEKKKK